MISHLSRWLALAICTVYLAVAQNPEVVITVGTTGGEGGGGGISSVTFNAPASGSEVVKNGTGATFDQRGIAAGIGVTCAQNADDIECASDDAVIPTKAASAGTPTMAGQLTGSIAVDTSASPDRLYFCGADDGTDCTAVIRLGGFDEMLPLAGGTLTGQLITDNLGIEFAESDTNPSCAAGNFTIYSDASENKLKKCENGVASDIGGSSLGFVWSGSFGGNTVGSGVTTFGAHYIGSFNTTENTRQWMVPAACTLRNLFFRVQGTQPAGVDLVVTVRVNGTTDTAITKTVAGSTTTSTLSDTVNSHAVNAGDRVTFKFVEGAGTSIGLFDISLQCN